MLQKLTKLLVVLMLVVLTSLLLIFSNNVANAKEVIPKEFSHSFYSELTNKYVVHNAEGEVAMLMKPSKDKVWATNALNVRKAPSINSKIVGVLDQYSEVEKLSEKNGWALIKYGKVYRFVCAKYLTDKKPIIYNYSEAGGNLTPTYDNILMLAQIMEAENGCSLSEETTLLTGIVVCQRVRAKSYPNTIRGVVSQRGQYSTWNNGDMTSIQPSKRQIEIARKILKYKLWKDYPCNLVFQSQFFQGKKIYKYIKSDNEYFCLA